MDFDSFMELEMSDILSTDVIYYSEVGQRNKRKRRSDVWLISSIGFRTFCVLVVTLAL